MLSLLTLHAINVEDARPGEWRLRAALIGLSLCSGVAFQDGDMSCFLRSSMFLCSTLRGLRLPVAKDSRLSRHRLLPGPMRPGLGGLGHFDGSRCRCLGGSEQD